MQLDQWKNLVMLTAGGVAGLAGTESCAMGATTKRGGGDDDGGVGVGIAVVMVGVADVLLGLLIGMIAASAFFASSASWSRFLRSSTIGAARLKVAITGTP